MVKFDWCIPPVGNLFNVSCIGVYIFVFALFIYCHMILQLTNKIKLNCFLTNREFSIIKSINWYLPNSKLHLISHLSLI